MIGMGDQIMKAWKILAFAGVLLLGAWLIQTAAYGEQPVAMNIQAPDFEKADEWINSKPLRLKDIRGKVIVVHFWTFG
jgi:hypothetical protein